jgi:hypothetical protein
MDTTASSFTARNNAKRAAEKMIANGKAPAVNYGIRPRDDGRFEIVWKTAPTTGEVEAEAGTAATAAEDGQHNDVESSKVIDLEKFVPRDDLDPVYFDSSYYLYPDGSIAVDCSGSPDMFWNGRTAIEGLSGDESHAVSSEAERFCTIWGI